MKLTRGSNLLGYAGMQMMHQDGDFIYVKPLLYTSKNELVDYATEHHVLYLNDSSNEDNYYLRNRYRHAIVPVMKQENENLLEQIKQYHLQLSSAFHFIRKTTIRQIPSSMIIDLSLFSSWDPVLQDDAIAYLIEHHDISFTFETVSKIKSMLLSSKPNQSYELGREYRFIKAYREAYITSTANPKSTRIELTPDSTIIENVAVFTFSYNSGAVTEEFIKLCYNELAFPLWLRHREEGDQLSYTYGHKKLKKLFIDLKIPMEERQKLWVLTDSNNQILWVEHHYINQTLGNDKTLYFTIKEDKKHA
jgi:bifunctional protein TilS/HprT